MCERGSNRKKNVYKMKFVVHSLLKIGPTLDTILNKVNVVNSHTVVSFGSTFTSLFNLHHFYGVFFFCSTKMHGFYTSLLSYSECLRHEHPVNQ
jgi:hypothetical protein